MSKLYFEILDKKRKLAWQQLANFASLGSLAGGTALALQLGHRYSYDFDLFVPKPLSGKLILSVQKIFGKKIKQLTNSSHELSFLTKDKVKVSFVFFPFPPLHRLVKTKSVSLFSLSDLASNKAYTVGRRGEYRDYVDLFFLLKNKKSLKLEKIIKETKTRFGGAFSKRLFLQQLVYFDDFKDCRIDFLNQSYQPEQVLKFFQSLIQKYRFR